MVVPDRNPKAIWDQPTASLKQPSLRRLTGKTLGRATPSLVQSTELVLSFATCQDDPWPACFMPVQFLWQEADGPPEGFGTARCDCRKCRTTSPPGSRKAHGLAAVPAANSLSGTASRVVVPDRSANLPRVRPTASLKQPSLRRLTDKRPGGATPLVVQGTGRVLHFQRLGCGCERDNYFSAWVTEGSRTRGVRGDPYTVRNREPRGCSRPDSVRVTPNANGESETAFLETLDWQNTWTRNAVPGAKHRASSPVRNLPGCSLVCVLYAPPPELATLRYLAALFFLGSGANAVRGCLWVPKPFIG